MTRRRIVNGHVFIQIRSGGWREVKNGCIRTRRGWRKLRSRYARKPAAAVVSESLAETMSVPGTTAEAGAVRPEWSRRQWHGKYAPLREEARG